MKKPRTEYIKKETYEINTILPFIKQSFHSNSVNKIVLDKDNIKINSIRLKTFYKNQKCVQCGIESKFFRKEKGLCDKSYHLNLYAIDEKGNEVLMTKDHIIPKSKGGSDKLKNLQTMCYNCNQQKSNSIKIQYNIKFLKLYFESLFIKRRIKYGIFS